jgi:hypothetical protein
MLGDGHAGTDTALSPRRPPRASGTPRAEASPVTPRPLPHLARPLLAAAAAARSPRVTSSPRSVMPCVRPDSSSTGLSPPASQHVRCTPVHQSDPSRSRFRTRNSPSRSARSPIPRRPRAPPALRFVCSGLRPADLHRVPSNPVNTCLPKFRRASVPQDIGTYTARVLRRVEETSALRTHRPGLPYSTLDNGDSPAPATSRTFRAPRAPPAHHPTRSSPPPRSLSPRRPLAHRPAQRPRPHRAGRHRTLPV